MGHCSGSAFVKTATLLACKLCCTTMACHHQHRLLCHTRRLCLPLARLRTPHQGHTPPLVPALGLAQEPNHTQLCQRCIRLFNSKWDCKSKQTVCSNPTCTYNTNLTDTNTSQHCKCAGCTQQAFILVTATLLRDNDIMVKLSTANRRVVAFGAVM